MNLSNFGRIVVLRPDHLNTRGGTRNLWTCKVDANNFFQLLLDASGNLKFNKTAASVLVSLSDAAATANAAGDTLAIGLVFDGATMTMIVSKNGAAVSTYTQATATTFTGTATEYFGSDSTGGSEADTTLSIVRMLKSNVNIANMKTALVAI